MMISMAVEAAVAGITTEDTVTVVIVTNRCAASLDRRLKTHTDLLKRNTE
jgi:vacuolar-type H+-ATPase subunit F/Vma7